MPTIVQTVYATAAVRGKTGVSVLGLVAAGAIVEHMEHARADWLLMRPDACAVRRWLAEMQPAPTFPDGAVASSDLLQRELHDLAMICVA